MGWNDADLYNEPEKFGLEQIGMLDASACWEFNMLVVWKHEDGRVFWAQDAGCSCPSPFEDFNKLEDATQVTKENWDEFQAAVEDFDGSNNPDGTQLLAKVIALF